MIVRGNDTILEVISEICPKLKKILVLFLNLIVETVKIFFP